MADLGDVGTNTLITPNCGVSVLHVYTDATPDASDTLTVDLTAHGCTNIHGIWGMRESTAGSIVVADQPTTSVTAGVLTLTIPAGADNKVRDYWIFAY